MSKVIIGTGHDLPATVLTNDDLERMGVGYDRARSGKSLDEWAMERVGVHSRHRVAPGEGTSDMGARAATRALDDAGIKASDLDLIVMSTFSSDYRSPSSAALLQGLLGARCKFFQIDAACPGFVDATICAAALMEAMRLETCLVVSSDASSTYCAPDNFMVQCLFGDGAGAVVLKNMPGSSYGIRSHYTAGNGKMGEALWVPGGGTREPVTPEMVAAGRRYALWAYKEVYPFAVQKMTEATQIAAERAGWDVDDAAWVIPHQAGRNIIVDSARRLEQPLEKYVINMDHTGNTSGASIPIALDETNKAGKLKDGDKILLPAMGAGLAWGALGLVWYDYKLSRN